jgi:hypothetical protein
MIGEPRINKKLIGSRQQLLKIDPGTVRVGITFVYNLEKIL